MSRLHQGAVILEGITHIEDLPLEKFIDTVENIRSKVATEKLDGANLWLGVDEQGFFTSREGKSKKNARFYEVEDYPMVANYNGFRAAHLALEQVKNTILKVLQPGDIVEVEVLFGRQPNTVTYGADNLNYIVILRGIGTDTEKVDKLANKLDDTTVTVTSTVISSPDGDKLEFNDEQLTWQFTQVKPVDNSKINSSDAVTKLHDLKKFLEQKNEAFPNMTNREVAEVKLGSVDKLKREAMKKEREIILAKIMSDYKLPIKEVLLNNYVRKIKPRLQTSELDPSEDVGMEGVVLRDKDSDDQVKLVDKDVFTAMNTFNNFIRSNISGLVRTDDQDSPIELRGGAFGQAKIRIAQLLGVKELAVSSTSKKTLEKFKGNSPEETAEKLASSINISSFESIKTKISAILDNAVDEIDTILIRFKAESGHYKLKLKTGKEIGISPEVMKRNLTAFAETKRDVRQIEQAISKAENPAQLVMALYGRTIQSLFNGSDDVKESFSLLKRLSEDGEAAPGGDVAGTPVAVPSQPEEAKLAKATKASAIAPVAKLLFTGSGKKVEKRKRNFIKRSKFARPTNESLLKSIVEFVDVNNQNATDVDDSVAAQKDIEFKQLRNNVNLGNDVTDQDVNRYLDKAHELNDEVDTVTFGMEMDDGSIVKVYVNADQADQFEDALSQMLGQFDDVEEVIDQLANTYDIVDVEWPQNYQAPDMTPDQSAEPQDRPDGAAVVDTNTDTAPQVNPVIDLGDTEQDDEATAPTDDAPSEEDGGIDFTFFGDMDDEGDGADAPETPDADDSVDGETPKDTEASAETTIDLDAQEPDTTDDDTSDDEVVGGEVATNDDDSSDGEEEDAEKKPAGDEEDEEEESEDEAKSKKKEESAMTIGQQFKMKLLAEKAAPKKDKKKEDNEKDQELEVAGLPASMTKLLQSFPTKGEKAMVVMLYALGAPVDAMALKKADLRKGVDASGTMYMKDSQFRLWIKRLTDELTKAQTPVAKESALEDELGNAMQRMIIEIMQKIGLPDSVERLARSALRANIRNTAKLALSNAKVRQYLKIVAEMLGIDATTGMVKEAQQGKNVKLKCQIPKGTYLGMMSLKDKEAAIFGEEEGDLSFAQNQTVVTIEDLMSIKDDVVTFSVISDDQATAKTQERLQAAFTRWCKNYDPNVELDESTTVVTGKQIASAAKSVGIESEYLDEIKNTFGFNVQFTLKDLKKKLRSIGLDHFADDIASKLALSEAAPIAQAEQSADQTGNEWVDEIMKLAAGLGFPQNILDYRRKQTEMAIKQQRQSMSNYSLVLRNIKKLNQIVGGNLKEDIVTESTDLGKLDIAGLEKAFRNSGYKGTKIDKIVRVKQKSDGEWIYTIDFKNDGSFNKASEAKNKKVFVCMKDDKIVAEF